MSLGHQRAEEEYMVMRAAEAVSLGGNGSGNPV